AFARTWD
ncbi:multi-copper polyphenol oxidoreductase laccase family protein, partial [Vibrio cholerae HC-50A2]